MQKLLTFFLLTLVGFSACKSAKIRKQTADELAVGLQQGVLLVRLQTAERKAGTLRELGREDEAREVLAEQQAFNQRVREAFERNYDFSPVYFFYAPDSRQIREKRFYNILQDSREQPVDVDRVAGKPFLVAEFSEVQSPAANAGLDALLVMDEQLEPLSMPFPFAVPTHLYPEEDMHERAVARLNLKLREFYTKAVYREQKRELRRMRRNLGN
jgi:hypothetical protein